VVEDEEVVEVVPDGVVVLAGGTAPGVLPPTGAACCNGRPAG